MIAYTEEKIQELYEKYPDFFPEKERRSYEIQFGWISIIEEACGKIYSYIDSLPKKNRPKFYFTILRRKAPGFIHGDERREKWLSLRQFEIAIFLFL